MKGTWYDKEEDVLNIHVKEGKYWKSVELSDGVVIDISSEGQVLSVEVLQAKKRFKGETKKVIEQALVS